MYNSMKYSQSISYLEQHNKKPLEATMIDQRLLTAWPCEAVTEIATQMT